MKALPIALPAHVPEKWAPVFRTGHAQILDDRDRHELLRWGLAGAVVLAAHAGLIASYMLLHRSDPVAAGAPVVLIELAPAPAAPDTAPAELQPEPEMVQAEQVPEQQVVELPVERPVEEPPPPVKTEVPPEVTPPPAVKPEVVSAVTPPPPKPKPKVEPDPKKPPAPKTVARASAPNVAQQAASARAVGISSAQASAAAADWRSLLIAHLQRNKRYPSGAQSRRETGTAVLSFTMDRGGHVLGRHIVRSSGNSELDAEVLAMIMRAQPLPAFPPSMTQPRMTLTVPIQFSLR